MRNLDKVTKKWRLFYKLTADFVVTADDIEARYLITEIVRSRNEESAIYFLADLDTEHRLALKVFKDRRTLKEDNVIKDIASREPNAVIKVHRTYWVPEAPRYRFILMDRGIPFRNFLLTLERTNDGAINPKLKEFIRGMASAVRAVHRQGYHHRDLRLDNFVICHENGQDIPKLIDFGLSLPSGCTGNSVNNQELVRPPEFVYLHRATPVEQVIYRDYHDIYALCLTFMELLQLGPVIYMPRNGEHELLKLYRAECDACRSEEVLDVLRLTPWYQAARLIFFCGIPPKSYRAFHDCPMGRYLSAKYRDFQELDYVHSEIMTKTLSKEPVFISMLRHALQWEPQARISDCNLLFELYLDRFDDI